MTEELNSNFKVKTQDFHKLKMRCCKAALEADFTSGLPSKRELTQPLGVADGKVS